VVLFNKNGGTGITLEDGKVLHLHKNMVLAVIEVAP
jgi:co-chaperonin GroES (HSP10)